ncbi:MAG: D-glycero-beta-D-manno-heptose-7-phosphate kinase [Flavobacteriales bacterium]|nr:D-glycero-beta-D-manno-heptose-7-phosphate kinase [Flavobacteriales bacterium]MCB9363201.1 D-glycero-beta-D-manno-heptose-7-phosphate kinase [Flavobacteriales bacterium]
MINLFNDFNKLNVLVIGDVMIDAYYFGKVDRISPEAPVPIVSVQNKDNRLGGAANVALNIQALGANPILCAVIGNDDDGKLFNQLLDTQELSNEGIITSNDRITTVKTRIIGNNHQVLRVDSETDKVLNESDNKKFIEKITTLINSTNIDAVIFEDYDKGTITEEVINEVVTICNNKNIPTTVDPKKRNFLSYKNVSLFKPNLKELREGLNIEINPKNIIEVSDAVDVLNKSLNNTLNFITLSENGVFIKNHEVSHHLAAHYRNIADVSGAGDTVISVATLCLALNQTPKMIAEISNLAGGLVCEKVGVVPIDKDQLLSEAISKLV